MNPITLRLYDTRLYDAYRRFRENQQLGDWARAGRPAPPPHLIKQAIVREHAQRFGLKVLVETGTYRGEMIRAALPHFEHVYSIELHPQLHAQAQRRFRNAPHVKLLHGNSADVLPQVLRELDQPALFWLDGHFSGPDTARANVDSPLREELSAVLSHHVPGHVVLIDDARLLALPSYPSLSDIRQQVAACRDPRRVELADDIVRITPG
ncbi:MAG: class I SAM-dependent methyltransferase [Polyangiales bacterium]